MLCILLPALHFVTSFAVCYQLFRPSGLFLLHPFTPCDPQVSASTACAGLRCFMHEGTCILCQGRFCCQHSSKTWYLAELCLRTFLVKPCSCCLPLWQLCSACCTALWSKGPARLLTSTWLALLSACFMSPPKALCHSFLMACSTKAVLEWLMHV